MPRNEAFSASTWKNWHDNTSFLIYLLIVIHIEIKPTAHRGLLSFHLKNLMQSKKNFKFVHTVAKWRLNSREILVRQKTIFFLKVRVTHHFFGNFMLNSNLKSAFENAKNFIFDEFSSSNSFFKSAFNFWISNKIK